MNKTMNINETKALNKEINWVVKFKKERRMDI